MYYSPVAPDTAGRPERLTAFRARERPFVCMRSIVNSQNVQGIEPLPTSFALKLPFISVISVMSPILRHYIEMFAANLASLLRRWIVNRLVYYETAFKFEFLVAYVTRISLLFGMYVEMADEVSRMLPAYFTHFPIVVSHFSYLLLFRYFLLRFNRSSSFR